MMILTSVPSAAWADVYIYGTGSLKPMGLSGDPGRFCHGITNGYRCAIPRESLGGASHGTRPRVSFGYSERARQKTCAWEVLNSGSKYSLKDVWEVQGPYGVLPCRFKWRGSNTVEIHEEK
jgi:hypothetical protein